jgi:putative DNA-invertase from lambdoid prophage Rac
MKSSFSSTEGNNAMIYAYVRIPKDKQTTENQRFEILKFADEKRLQIDEWVDETVTGVKKARLRKLGPLLDRIRADDMLIVSEISRLGRSLMEVMSILYQLMEKDVKVFTVKERYELGNNINSKVLAFAFSLSAEIERSMISSHTKEALARKKLKELNSGGQREGFQQSQNSPEKRTLFLNCSVRRSHTVPLPGLWGQ